ncbi:MAG: carbamoyl phosphate synthase small subunit [Treponema sp.]|nr:carbamoyl phosphate synthase small subunit [Treponema sp.]
MSDNAWLILENGTIFEGKFFGVKGDVTGEIVFTTGMTGYLETLTDQSYHGQIVLQTFPLIGNYGIIPSDFESAGIGAKAYIVKYPCAEPSNFRSEGNLDAFFKERGITGLCGIDTRALTKIIRKDGVMNGKICSSPPTDADLAEAKAYKVSFPIGKVSSREASKMGSGGRRIALMDFGVKRGIIESLTSRNCEVWIFPCDTPAEEILKIKPDGVMLGNGPGDPADPGNVKIIDTITSLDKSGKTIFGICMGHQLLARTKGHSSRKLKFGHRGSNQPVRETKTGQVYITSQNHGYEVLVDDSKTGDNAFVNVNDGTCEGLDYGNSFSVQFHPEARGGPLDTGFLFDRFLERIDANAAK